MSELMTKDGLGRELKRGDRIMVPMDVFSVDGKGKVYGTVAASSPIPDDGMAGLEVHGRQVLRANEGDDTRHKIIRDSEKSIIR